jgi:hypothetical protein
VQWWTYYIDCAGEKMCSRQKYVVYMSYLHRLSVKGDSSIFLRSAS